MIRRSLLATPANTEAMLLKARAFPVDVLMLDLEDGVPNEDGAKARARQLLGEALAVARRSSEDGGRTEPAAGAPFAAREIAIRINGPRTKWFLEDAAFVAGLGVPTVVLPMVEDAADVVYAERTLAALGAPASLGLILLIETPAGVLNLPEMVKASPRINGLIAGGLDYAMCTHSLSILPFGNSGGAGRHDDDLLYMRQRVLAVARAHKLSAIDAMRPGLISDLDAFRADAAYARWLGFDGVDFYHPAFIDTANDVFTPSPEELAWAERVLGANEGGDGARVVARRSSVDGGRTTPAAGSAPASRKIDGRVILPQHVEIARRLKTLAADIARG